MTWVGMVLWDDCHRSSATEVSCGLWLDFRLEDLFPEFHQQLIDCLVPIPDVQPGGVGDRGTPN